MKIKTVSVDRHPTGYSTDGGGLQMQVSLPCEPWTEAIRVEVQRCTHRGCNRPVGGAEFHDGRNDSTKCPEHAKR